MRLTVLCVSTTSDQLRKQGRPVNMQPSYDRFPNGSSLRWAASFGLALALALQTAPVAAQQLVQTSPIAATPADCAIQLSVANPNAGDQEIPRSLVMSGTALDGTTTSGTGIAQVQAFLGDRDAGGTFIGAASFAPSGGLPGAWSLTATIPPALSGGQNMFIYGRSSVSGQEAIVSIPIVVGEALTNASVPSTAQSFCPIVVPAKPTSPPVIEPPRPPTLPASPSVVAPAPQPTAPPIAPVAPAPAPAAPANLPMAAQPPSALQLSISSPAAPPLTFNTTTLSAPAGAQVTVTYTNNSTIPHNWHLFSGPDSSPPSLAQTQVMTGPSAIDAANFTAPTQAGNYFFWCDVHPTIMTGNLVVTESE
jgi:plastocyanin